MLWTNAQTSSGSTKALNLVSFLFSKYLALKPDPIGIFISWEILYVSFFVRSELHESNAIGIYRFAEGHNIEGLRWFDASIENIGGCSSSYCGAKKTGGGEAFDVWSVEQQMYWMGIGHWADRDWR